MLQIARTLVVPSSAIAVLVTACNAAPLHRLPSLEHNGATTTRAIGDNDASGDSTGGGAATCFTPASFAFPEDALSCHGDQFQRFDDTYGLTVGVVLCGDSEEQLRIYLSDDGATFFPAAHDARNGQDQCEILNPQFTTAEPD